MALLEEKNLAAEAAKRARFRVHHVGTKLNEGEQRELEALAVKRSQTQAELIRGLILHEIEQDKTGLRASAEMVEITACRLLLTHLLRPLATGEAMTEQTYDGIVKEVKKQKDVWPRSVSKIAKGGAEDRRHGPLARRTCNHLQEVIANHGPSFIRTVLMARPVR